MRLHYGAYPEDPDFHPESEGWQTLPFDPRPVFLVIMSIAALFLLALVWGLLFFVILPVRVTPVQMLGSEIVIFGWLPTLLVLAPVHEFLHALAHPNWGRSSKTVIGIWLVKGMLYAHYEGAMSRNRYVLVALAPYLFLGLLPLGVLALPAAALWPPSVVHILGMVSLLLSIAACLDIVIAVLLLFQIPATALVRNNGSNTYWRPASP